MTDSFFTPSYTRNSAILFVFSSLYPDRSLTVHSSGIPALLFSDILFSLDHI